MSCPETEHFVSNWNRIHKQTARALAAAPDDKLDWRPAEGMFTLRELLRHIPEAESAIIHTVLAGTMQKGDLELSAASVDEMFSMPPENGPVNLPPAVTSRFNSLSSDESAFNSGSLC